MIKEPKSDKKLRSIFSLGSQTIVLQFQVPVPITLVLFFGHSDAILVFCDLYMISFILGARI